MALSSQMSRSDRPTGSWGSTSHYRRRKNPAKGIVLLLAAAGALGVGGWGLWSVIGGGPSDDDGADSTLVADRADAPRDPLAADSLGLSTPLPPGRSSQTPTQTPVQTAPPPVVLEMGRSAPQQQRQQQAPVQQQQSPAQTQTQLQPAPHTTAPAAVVPPAVVTTPPPSRLNSEIAAWVAAAERARSENRLVEARTLLNKALVDSRTGEADRAALRSSIADLNQTLVFSPTVIKGDPLTDTYSVQSGDSLARITARLGLGVDWRLVQRINRISNPSRIQVGQKLKVVRGPFHAVVDKSDFRMDIYAGEPVSASAAAVSARADGIEPGWIYIRSFRVGLGEHGTTPIGTFIVRPRSKLINPFWKNPRTGEEFAADNPLNPIGEHWMGLEGLDEATKQYEGYGVHGTIAPDSIGKEMSMGCVRLVADDIALVYEMLEEGVSIVRIVP